MKIIEPINSNDFYVLTDPNGVVQLATIAPNINACKAFVKALELCGIGKTIDDLMNQGYSFERINITITPYNKITAQA